MSNYTKPPKGYSDTFCRALQAVSYHAEGRHFELRTYHKGENQKVWGNQADGSNVVCLIPQGADSNGD